MQDLQWYPGHMTKARRMMEENKKLVDLVIEILDARIPLSSRNPDIDSLTKGKARIVILAKTDLADPAATKAFLSWFASQGVTPIAVDARQKKSLDRIRDAVKSACREKMERDRRRGILNRPVRAMVLGIPNVGKSTLINSMAGRASAKTGNKPGVTKGKQWICVTFRQGKEVLPVELLDTPGILWPKFEDREVGVRLALCGSIREEILDEKELACSLISLLLADYPEAFNSRYGKEGEDFRNILEETVEGTGHTVVDQREAALHRVLAKIAENRNFLSKGQTFDEGRAAHLLIDEFQGGKIGRITLDHVPERDETKTEAE